MRQDGNPLVGAHGEERFERVIQLRQVRAALGRLHGRRGVACGKEAHRRVDLGADERRRAGPLHPREAGAVLFDVGPRVIGDERPQEASVDVGEHRMERDLLVVRRSRRTVQPVIEVDHGIEHDVDAERVGGAMQRRDVLVDIASPQGRHARQESHEAFRRIASGRRRPPGAGSVANRRTLDVPLFAAAGEGTARSEPGRSRAGWRVRGHSPARGAGSPLCSRTRPSPAAQPSTRRAPLAESASSNLRRTQPYSFRSTPHEGVRLVDRWR